MSKHFILAYCQENNNIASEIDANLSRAGYSFTHISSKGENQDLGKQLKNTSEKIILILSENFLHDISCLKDSLSWYQSLKGRITTVVTDGRFKENGQWKSVSTGFERVSSVIKYMKYWQDMYLDLRREKREKSRDDDDFNQKITDVRQISSEIGEFLRLVRSSEYHYYPDFSKNSYALFFEQNNDDSGHNLLLDQPVINLENSDSPTEPIAEPQENNKESAGIEVIIEDEVEEVQATTDSNMESTVVEEELEEEVESELLANIPGMNLLNRKEEVFEGINSLTSEDNSENEASESFEEIIETIVQEDENIEPSEEELEKIDADLFTEESDKAEEKEVISATDLFDESEEDLEEPISDEQGDQRLETIENILKNSRSYLAKNEVPDALNLLKKGTEDFPEEVNLRYYYAFVLANNADKITMAKEELKKIFALSPSHTDAHYLAGEIAELNQDFLAAKRHYEKVLDSNNEYPNAHYRIGSVLAKRFVGQENRAAVHFKQAAKQDKSNVDALYQAAKLYEVKLKDGVRAEKYYKKVLKAEEENTEALMGLARVARLREELDLAKNYYKQAVQIEPNLATEANQKLFAPNLVSKPYVSPKDVRIQEMEGELTRLQAKLKKTEEELRLKSIEKEESVTSEEISKMQAYANGNGSTTVSVVPLTAKKEEKNQVDKTVLITGATSGIGRATADLFAENGFKLILTGRRHERLDELKKKYESDYQSNVEILNFDVRDQKSVEEALGSLSADWKNIDILINNAGLAKGFAPIQEGEMRHWEQMIDTNIKGLLYVTRVVAPEMTKRRKGHIINVCSTAGHEVYANGNVYCATKHAVDALTKSMRIDLHKHNVRVGQISPGHVEETEFALVRFDGDAERAKIYDDFLPLTSRDVAESIYFMATRPAHVNIQDVLLMGTQQASSNHIDRSGRE